MTSPQTGARTVRARVCRGSAHASRTVRMNTESGAAVVRLPASSSLLSGSVHFLSR